MSSESFKPFLKLEGGDGDPPELALGVKSEGSFGESTLTLILCRLANSGRWIK